MAETTFEQRDRLALRDRLLDVFLTAARERPQRQDLVDVGYGLECAWVDYERQQMLAAVNGVRAERGLPPVDMATIARVETQACGHVDYASKYALYCSELAVGLEPR